MSRNSLIALIVIATVVGLGLVWDQFRTVPSENAEEGGGPIVSVTVPLLMGAALDGEQIFNAKCAACHGENAAGRLGAGPPLVHKVYEPSHHGDMAFMLAPRRGVPAQHWPFGDMPPVEGLTDGDIKQVISYVRTLQRANGIN